MRSTKYSKSFVVSVGDLQMRRGLQGSLLDDFQFKGCEEIQLFENNVH